MALCASPESASFSAVRGTTTLLFSKAVKQTDKSSLVMFYLFTVVLFLFKFPTFYSQRNNSVFAATNSLNFKNLKQIINLFHFDLSNL